MKQHGGYGRAIYRRTSSTQRYQQPVTFQKSVDLLSDRFNQEKIKVRD